jgi:hypothetical protein
VRLRPAAARPQSGAGPRPQPRAVGRAIAVFVSIAPYAIRRDFISWAAVVVVALHATQVLFAAFVVGGAVTFVIVTIDHIQLRRLRRSIVRGGQILEPAP